MVGAVRQQPRSLRETVTALADGQSRTQGPASWTQFRQACFTGEMLIDAEQGKKRAYQIQVGDRLWSRDEHDPNGSLALKEVEEVFIRVAPIWNVHVAGQIIRTTAEHPFWVQGRGWIPAAMLEIGDLLSTRNGEKVPVDGVAESGQVETVYNWRVADYHTYFVSASDGATSIWAHNAGGGYAQSVPLEVRRGAVDRAWKEEADMVRRTGRGTRRWTDAQKRELLATGRVRRYQGHHINNVNDHPLFAGLSDNVEFLTRAQHFRRHGFNWNNLTTGPILSRG